MSITQATATTYFKEADIRLFMKEPRGLASKLRLPLAIVAGSGLLAVASFAILNFSALSTLYNTPKAEIVTAAPHTQAPDPQVTAVVPTPAPTPSLPTLPENTLALADLGVSAPVKWDVPFDEKVIQQQLKEGVVHIDGTAVPGQQGWTAISGHSSNFPWVKGSYNTVFAPLLKAQVGQNIVVNYNNKEFVYKVTKTYEVKPTDLSPLGQDGKAGIRLITCTPLGTSLRRLIVEAEQISPPTDTNTAFMGGQFSGYIPSAR